MSSLTLAMDFGASTTRCFFTLDEPKPELILMEPEVSLVTPQSLELYDSLNIGTRSPENGAWIEFEGQYQAVGFLAKNRFNGNLQLGKRKFELAVPKVLAMVGVLADQHDLPNGMCIRLAVVFPWGEYRDRAIFKSAIADALTNYKFRGQEKSFALDTFICLPEGGGVFTRGREPGLRYKEQKILVLMLGYRDISVLLVNRGDMSEGLTKPLGFSKMTKSVEDRTPISDPNKLLDAICFAGKNVNPRALLPLVEQIGDKYKNLEISRIRKAIADARVEYWLMLSEWLKLQISRDLDEVVIAGGTANFFRSELSALFSFTKVNWCDELENQIRSNFEAQVAAKSLSYRLTDVYGLFFYLCGLTQKQKAKING